MKKNLVSAIIISTLVAMAPAANAANRNGEIKKVTNVSETGASMNVQYIGQEDEYVILKVVINTQYKNSGEFNITDADGIQLYSSRVRGNNYDLTFKVSPSELPSIELIFNHSNGTIRKMYALYRTVNIDAGIEEKTSK